MPVRSTVPCVGLKPTTPQNAAGRISDPAVWLPKAIGTIEAPTAAAEPLEEPPGVWAGLCGFFVLPGQKVANSVETVLPISTAPADRIAATQAASRSGRWPPWIAGAPYSVGSSPESITSLTPNGTPCSGLFEGEASASRAPAMA